MKNTLTAMFVAVLMATSPLYAQEEQCPETVVSTEYIEIGFLKGEDSFSKCEIRKISTDCNNDDAEKIILVETFVKKNGDTIHFFIEPNELKIADYYSKPDSEGKKEYLYSKFYVIGPSESDDINSEGKPYFFKRYISETSPELYEYVANFYNNSLPFNIVDRNVLVKDFDW